ncbi:MAG: Holliday junction resolvase RuvX [Clostridia bacterium]|nr:Holliday junction resolvase RuvX [Clostridia bacterium]
MKAMGIDYGEARIGVALSDLLKMLASPYTTYLNKHTDEDYQYFLDLIKREKVDTIVVGLPYNMQGEEQAIATKAREFANNLERLSGCKLVLIDERMTSVVAEDILKQKYRDWRDRKKHLDEVSAMVILQDYLDTL